MNGLNRKLNAIMLSVGMVLVTYCYKTIFELKLSRAQQAKLHADLFCTRTC